MPQKNERRFEDLLEDASPVISRSGSPASVITNSGEGGREGGREGEGRWVGEWEGGGELEGWRERGREGEREGGREGEREGGREGGRDRERDRGREGGRERARVQTAICRSLSTSFSLPDVSEDGAESPPHPLEHRRQHSTPSPMNLSVTSPERSKSLTNPKAVFVSPKILRSHARSFDSPSSPTLGLQRSLTPTPSGSSPHVLSPSECVCVCVCVRGGYLSLHG